MDLHQDAYQDEVPYTGPPWDGLIEYFLSENERTILTIRKAGYLIGACLSLTKESYESVYSVCIRKDYQGRGIGHILFNEYIKAKIKNTYQLSVVYSNLPARILYERFGFKIKSINYLVYNLSQTI